MMNADASLLPARKTIFDSHVWYCRNRDTVEDAEATGGVIDGGTWEHRKRAKEMLKTAEGALSLTIQGKGAHHMGQYLPKDVSTS